jgi:4-carboxymuconolactone decarboxylase
MPENPLADFAPVLVGYTNDVLFGQVWEQLTFHLDYAKRNGLTELELIEAITHLAFYAGWPKAMSAMAIAKSVFAND